MRREEGAPIVLDASALEMTKQKPAEAGYLIASQQAYFFSASGVAGVAGDGAVSAAAGAVAGLAAVGAAAIGGAVGSIASQAVGMLTGDVQRFSWRGVATSALTAGVGAGVGAAAQALGWTRTATAVAMG